MGAKINCKKGYNTDEGYVEFSDEGRCPASGEVQCFSCKVKSYEFG